MRYATLFIIFVLLYSCGSRKQHTRNDYVRDQSETIRKASSEKVERESVSTLETATSIDTHISEYIKITMYNDSGRVSEVQEKWRNTRSAELGTGSGRSSENTIEQKADTIHSHNALSEEDKSTTTINKSSSPTFYNIMVIALAIYLILLALSYFTKSRK